MTFDNGEVRLADPLKLNGDFSSMLLRQPRFLGSGGGGAVYAFVTKDNNDNTQKSIVVKVSWSRSTSSVIKECAILRYMEQYNIRNVETCLNQAPYTEDSKRVMIAMKPLVDDES
eukprot:7503428-Ditylum_brightwellii.AAC.1